MTVFQIQRESEQLNSAKASTSLNVIPHSQLDDTAEKSRWDMRSLSNSNREGGMWRGGRATVKGSVWGEYQFQVVL